jgi:tetratricopeptide (TPR) repeat protein
MSLRSKLAAATYAVVTWILLQMAEVTFEPLHFPAWALNLGMAGLIEQGDKEKAMQWAERSLAIDGDNPDTLYNVACAYACLHEPERALASLGRAKLHGMSIAERAENDSDLASLNQRYNMVGRITAFNPPPVN